MAEEPNVSPLIAFIKANRSRILDDMVGEQMRAVPALALANPLELRSNFETFIDGAMAALEKNQGHDLMREVLADLRRRFEEGLPLADYLRATLVIAPAARRFVRESGPPGDPRFAGEFAKLEMLLHELAAAAASSYVELASGRLRSKNMELNRLNQELAAREKAMSHHADQTSKALDASNEFNRRVIEGLTSGMIVVDSETLKVVLFTRRAEEILGLPAEALLGHDIREVARQFAELDFDPGRLVEAVRAQGHLPLTKMRLRLFNGRSRSIYVRADRMYGADGNPEGTILLIDDVTERELLVDSFARYVSRDVVTRLLSRGETPSLEGERRYCTILFADIRGFTSLSEKTSPEALHSLLNAYFGVMIDAIFAHGGFIDKFIGDKVMAIFNAPDLNTAALSAVRSAQEIQKRIRELSQARVEQGEVPILLGVGLNSGEVLLGNIGNQDRMEFTAIGDVVNVADRLQSAAGAGEILVGAATADLVKSKVACTPLGPRPMKGKAEPVAVFRVPASGAD